MQCIKGTFCCTVVIWWKKQKYTTSFLNPDEDFDRKKKKKFSWLQCLTSPDFPSSCSGSWWRRRHRRRRYRPPWTSSCSRSDDPLASTGREWESSFWKEKEDRRHRRRRRLCLFWSFLNLVCRGLSFLLLLLPRHRPHPRFPILPCPPPPSSPRKRGFGNCSSVFTQRGQRSTDVLFTQKSLWLTKHRSCKLGKDRTLRQNGADVILGLLLKSQERQNCN